MKLADILDARLIIPDLTANRQSSAFEEMAAALADKTGMSADAVVKALKEREATRPTAMEKGVAIPHARIEGATRFFLLIARSKAGMDFKAEDGQLSRLFFMIVGPEDRPHDYLRLLARVARICQSDSFRKSLVAAQTTDEIVKIVMEEDARV